MATYVGSTIPHGGFSRIIMRTMNNNIAIQNPNATNHLIAAISSSKKAKKRKNLFLMSHQFARFRPGLCKPRLGTLRKYRWGQVAADRLFTERAFALVCSGSATSK
jgi:hypothetical protein